jgi:uncharacterized membrane protein YsdA (DUF1294 family)
MSDQHWEDARRVEAWAGEIRINFIRVIGLAIFYSYHLLNAYVLSSDPDLRGRYNAAVTAVVVAWAAGAFALYSCLSRRWVPPILKFVAAGWDLAMVTALLIAGREGPRSPLVLLYFAIVATSALRLSLRLVTFATLGAMVAATISLGDYVFFVVGTEAYYAADSTLRIPRSYEVIFLLCIGACGLLAGQSVRQARRLVAGYPVLVEEPAEVV